ncbi:MAG: PglZ domain-containing protein [Collinsella sp.]
MCCDGFGLASPAAALQKLSNHIAPAYAPYCIAVVREWAGDAAASDELREICELVQDACGLRHVFGALPTDDLLRLDVFPCVDEAILSDLLASLAQGADRVDEARRVAAARRDLCWYDDVACYYRCFGAGPTAFKRDHAGGFHIAQAAEVWEAYTTDWWRMDAAYRALRQANERCKLRGVDLLEEPERRAVEWAENNYVNWYLTESNACWANAAQAQWRDAGYVEGVARQDLFYWETLPTYTGSAKAKVVLISDALRYEVAQDVAAALESAAARCAWVACRRCFLITEMGMPALLPHQAMTLNMETGAVLLDDMPTSSTVERQAVLQKAAPAVMP